MSRLDSAALVCVSNPVLPLTDLAYYLQVWNFFPRPDVIDQLPAPCMIVDDVNVWKPQQSASRKGWLGFDSLPRELPIRPRGAAI